jgi:uncharacterized protein
MRVLSSGGHVQLLPCSDLKRQGIGLKHSLTAADAVYWNGGHAVGTRFFDALSILLPQGEQFVIRAAQDAAVLLKTPGAEVQGLIDDEHAHQRAHCLDQRRLQRQRGPATGLIQHVEAVMAPLHHQPLAVRLASACAFEYLTVLLARRVLQGRGWLTPSAVPQARLWRWHCAEEIAHGHVLLALAAQHRIRYGQRVACYLAASMVLAADVVMLMRALLRDDCQARGVRRFRLVRELCGAARLVFTNGPVLLWGWLRYWGPLAQRGPDHGGLPPSPVQPCLRLGTRRHKALV